MGQLDPDKADLIGNDWMYEDIGTLLERILILCPGVYELWIAGAKELQLTALSKGTSESSSDSMLLNTRQASY